MDAKKTTESSPLAVHLSVWHPVADRNVNSYDCYTIHLYTDIKVSLGLRSTTDAHVEFHMQNVGSTTLRLSVTFKNSHWGDWQPMTKTFTLEPEKYLPGEDGGVTVCLHTIVSNSDNNHRELPRQLFFENQDTHEKYLLTLNWMVLVDPDERRVGSG